MYELVSAATRTEVGPKRFDRAYDRAARTATLQRIRAGRLREVADGFEEAADALEHVAHAVETIAVKES